MKGLIPALAAALMTTQVVIVPEGLTTGNEDPEVTGLPCPPRPESEPAEPRPPDVSLQGLVFDPGAPGGARPAERRESMPVPVNPRTVTIFPAPQQPSTTEDREEPNDSIPQDCRA